MTKNEIKKFLYKNKPQAKLVNTDTNMGATYMTKVDKYDILFYIPKEEPYNEDGKKIFADTMESQLLIRWLVYSE